MPFGLGFFAAAGAGGGAAGSYQLISTTTLSSGADTVTFSNIPQTFTHLQIRALARAPETNLLTFRFNSDSSFSYSHHGLQGDGSAVSSFTGGANDDKLSLQQIVSGSSAPANAFSPIVLDILDYKNTSKNTTTKALSGCFGTNRERIGLISGVYRKTDAITSIVFYVAIGQLAAGSRYSLYGIS